MPSSSQKQHNLMAMVAHNPSAAKRLGIAQSVGRDFVNADRGRKFGSGGIIGFDGGGDIVASAAQTVDTQNPLYQSSYQRFAGMPVERLQELAVMLPANSQQGRIVQAALQAKQIGTEQSAPAASSDGDGVQKFAGGGPMSASEGSPWWTRSEAHQDDSSGFLHSTVGGRTDHIPASTTAGSYVIPADVVSGISEGNSLSGARVIEEMLRTGPWGTPLPRGGGGHGLPSPPAPARDARGGKVNGSGQKVPVLLAGGEYVLKPAQVRAVGRGDLKRGHQVLDAWVKHERAKIIKTMKKLPGPKRS